MSGKRETRSRIRDVRAIRRALGVVGIVALVAPAPALPAQESTRVRLEVGLSSDSAADEPVVRTIHLLAEPRWPAALRSGFTVRLHYRVEVWRARAGWFDAFQKQAEWDVVVQHEPLLDQYTMIRVVGQNRTERRYASLETLAATLEFANRVTTMRPRGEGEYYYIASLQISTLSDSDLDELERFLQGDLRPVAQGEENMGSAMGRGAKRLVLKLAGLPSLRLEKRSERFRVSGER